MEFDRGHPGHGQLQCLAQRGATLQRGHADAGRIPRRCAVDIVNEWRPLDTLWLRFGAGATPSGAADTANLGSGAYFNGLIQNISIFNSPLSNTEVRTLYGGGGGVTVTLSSSSAGGSFSYPNGSPIIGGQIVIPPGASSATFDYTDTQPGTPTLTAAATGFHSVTQQETILPAPIAVTPQTSIVVGRVLSSYDVPDVRNNQNQLTITYTVYNQATDPEIGVLLTTTLEPGVTFLSSSITPDGTTITQLPDQSGQNLAWSLGTIQGGDRISVTVLVSVSNPIPLQLDRGAQAFATFDAGAVSASTPAATLSPSAIDPNLLGATPDADTNDPFIQEEAAQLDYDAQNIFNFLHTQIGYNSYSGSMRGARGTLWNDAGNALDVASLGVALICASGIHLPQYVQGMACPGARPSRSSSRCSRPAIRRLVTSPRARRSPTRRTTSSSSPRPRAITGSSSTPATAWSEPTR